MYDILSSDVLQILRECISFAIRMYFIFFLIALKLQVNDYIRSLYHDNSTFIYAILE